MSIFHLSVQVIGRSSGRSSTAAAAYRAACRIVDERTGEVHDFTRKSGVRETFILAPESATAWMRDRSSLWNGVEHAEKRRDAQLCREVEIGLPHEIPHEERRRLLVEFIESEFVGLGMIADVAMHAPGKDGDRRNEHAHVLLTMRSIEGDGFGNKNRNWNRWNDAEHIENWRARWAQHINQALEAHGISEKVDHRSYERQARAAGHEIALAPLPTAHLGPQASAMERNGVATVPGDLNREVRIVNLELERARRSMRADVGRSLPTPTPAEDDAGSRRRHLRHQLRDALGFTRMPTAEEAKEEIRRQRHELTSRQHGGEELQRAIRRASEASWEVKRLSEARTHLERVGSGTRKQAKALVAAREWRAAHPLRARLHDWGLFRVPQAEMGRTSLGELRAQFKEARVLHDQVVQQLEVARRQSKDAADTAAQLQARVDQDAAAKREGVTRLDQAEDLADGLQHIEEAEQQQQLEPASMSSTPDTARPIPRLRSRGPAPGSS